MTASLVGKRTDAVGVDVVILEPDEWRTLRDLRLQSLIDAPEAFLTTWAVEEQKSDGCWKDQLETTTWVIARIRGRGVGIAALVADEDSASTARYLESVWVAPEYRDCRVMRAMVNYLERHAADCGLSQLRLWVLDTNDSARDAYLRLGFQMGNVDKPTSKKRLNSGSNIFERLMVKPLRRSPRPR